MYFPACKITLHCNPRTPNTLFFLPCGHPARACGGVHRHPAKQPPETTRPPVDTLLITPPVPNTWKIESQNHYVFLPASPEMTKTTTIFVCQNTMFFYPQAPNIAYKNTMFFYPHLFAGWLFRFALKKSDFKLKNVYT